jgi:hypothetical protein
MGLPWIRVDTQMMNHPKIATLILDRQHKLVVVHVAAMLWSGHHGTGGHIPIAALGFVSATRADAAKLVDAGLWDVDADGRGWWVHDWTDYNLGQAALEAQRDRARTAALKRWQK